MMKNENRTGRILSGIVALALVGSAISKIAGVPKMVDGLIHAGIPAGAILPIALLELTCLALFLIPRTAMLGTLLLTGYFGGALLTHLIGGENVMPPMLVGLLVWGGAYFRIPEFRELVPLRRDQPASAAAADHRAQPRIAVRG